MENPITIFLSINNEEKTMQIPILPSEIDIPQTLMANETFSTVNGEIQLIGVSKLRKITITSFFPDNPYSFDKTGQAGFEGWGGQGIAAKKRVEELQRWIKRRLPIRLRIPYYNINMGVTIDNFTPKVKDGSRDIYYTLEMTEFVFPQLKVQKATGRVKPTVPKFEKYVPPPKEEKKSSSSKNRPGKGYDSVAAKWVRDYVAKHKGSIRITSAGRSKSHPIEAAKIAKGKQPGDHARNSAYDVGGSKSVLDKLAADAKASGLFKQIIWRNRDLFTGRYISDHDTHVHLAWK